MHEYSLVQALVDRVAEEAKGRRATVRCVRIKLGELAGVDAQLLVTAYETFKPQTVCAEAALELTQVPARWSCRICGGPIERGERLQCCGEPARLVQGDDLVLHQIDLEVA
ncbi:MAG TPA: hydrogenase maturation nickel metallochaperone HypA [Myxococcales bacterium]|nr:hydrogenase maturation nickel metallochaperone HypA [Myxococcales bacterium]